MKDTQALVLTDLIISNNEGLLEDLFEKEPGFIEMLNEPIANYGDDIKRQFDEEFCELPIMVAVVYAANKSFEVSIIFTCPILYV